MKKVIIITLLLLVILLSCNREYFGSIIAVDNPWVELRIPEGFPAFNEAVENNRPTKYGVELGEKLFHENKFSGNNTISCASCHNKANAFTDNKVQAVGIYGRPGMRNTPPIQNLAFMKFYNWDGSKLALENQALVPIITHEEMNSSILEVIGKLKEDPTYAELFKKAFGDTEISPDKIYKSLAQYQYTLISSNSKYDRVKRKEGESFTASEKRGYQVFTAKCATCHSTALFTDQSFRNIGFPINPSTEEAGRARVTGEMDDLMRFRVPSLRNLSFTAPYGSFGQFETLMELLDYLDSGVVESDNLDPILKNNGNRIPLSVQEKMDVIDFLKTLNDDAFVGR